MKFSEYEKVAGLTAYYPDRGENLVYPTLGLVGEAGEVAEKIKKMIRDDNGMLSVERKDLLIKELGDVLWYLAAMAYELKVPLEEIAQQNITKLKSRAERNTIHGNGDLR